MLLLLETVLGPLWCHSPHPPFYSSVVLGLLAAICAHHRLAHCCSAHHRHRVWLALDEEPSVHTIYGGAVLVLVLVVHAVLSGRDTIDVAAGPAQAKVGGAELPELPGPIAAP